MSKVSLGIVVKFLSFLFGICNFYALEDFLVITLVTPPLIQMLLYQNPSMVDCLKTEYRIYEYLTHPDSFWFIQCLGDKQYDFFGSF